jgi:site-specific DNA-methyltransferase (adenine-specific)
LSKRLLGKLELNRIYQRDCLEGMVMIPDKSIDMILCDLPYGTTSCKWDTVIPFEPLWEQYERVIKDNGAIVLTATEPFKSLLVTSNLSLFKYELIWDKVKPTGFQIAKIKPMNRHENVLVFGKGRITYNPQKEKRDKPRKSKVYGLSESVKTPDYNDERILTDKNPTSILTFSNANNRNRLHPTQKPVDLFAYLIRTYTNEGDIILDNCMGSGTTAIAALRTGRQFIGFETEPSYVEIANKRIDNELEAN